VSDYSEHDDQLLAELYADEPGEAAPVRRRRAGRRSHRGAVFAAGFVVVVIAALGVGFAGGLRALVHSLGGGAAADYSGSGTCCVDVVVHTGDTATAIGQTLQHDGVVASVAAFTSAATVNSRSGLIEPGVYRLHHHMQASIALAWLLRPSSLISFRVLVPPGFTEAETLYRIATVTKIPLAALQRAARQPAALGLPPACGGQLEGCLFPATYTVSPAATATEVLQQMVAAFQQAAGQVGLQTRAARLGLTPYQVLTIASILQHEARLPADFAKVARVILNRLHIGLPLQLNSTLEYALHIHQAFLTNAQTHIASRYNTYLHTGLPPTPIGNADLFALSAALHPAAGPWLYFVTINRAGTDMFTASFAQFQQWQAEAQRNFGQ
jgi:UPF0755 protein